MQVEGASYESVSELRSIPANPDNGMYVAGELCPGTYRLEYSFYGENGAENRVEEITFTSEYQEIVLD